jgi:thiosulfate dehydrogenase [quinone] large subunit
MAQGLLRKGRKIQDPPFAKVLLGDSRAGWLWLIPRVWLGYQWLEAGIAKLGNPGWTVTGEALKGFWTSAVAVPATGRPPIAFDWYRAFIQSLLNAGAYTWFSKVVVAGELLVGVGLVLGAFTGIAAFVGAFMNWNYMMAGSASVNPVYFVVAVGLILAWKVAGAIGLDHFLLPLIGTPWTSASEEPLPQTARGGGKLSPERRPSHAGD